MAIDTDLATIIASVTLTTQTVSTAHQCDNMEGYCVQAVVSNGSFTAGMYAWLQGSLDGTTYTHISGSTLTVAGTGSSYMWNVDAPYYNYVQCGFTMPSGNIVTEVKIRTIGER